MDDNKRTTIIVGAGAPLDLCFSNSVLRPTTANITDEVCKTYKNYLDTTKMITLVDDVRKRLIERFPKPIPPFWKRIRKNDIRHINFEQIFHVLEMLYSYDRAWNGSCNVPHLYPVFAPFTKSDFKDDDFRHLSSVMEQFILRVMDIIGNYDKDFCQNLNKHGWYVDFFRTLGKNADIFNFNYDTTIEKCLQDYEDGFEKQEATEKQEKAEPFMAFNPKRLIENPNKLTTINHLHGCINYYFATYKDINYDVYTNQHHDLYKYDNYDTVHKLMIGRGQCQPTSQSGETYYAAPIITGLRKTDKLNSSPFDFYHTKMVESIIANPKLIIVGYGFGDLYCNQLLDRMYALHGTKCRIVLIDYWNFPESELKWHGGYALGQELGTFICKMMQTGDFNNAVSELYKNNQSKGYYVSDNGNLMVFIHGFKNAAMNWQQIRQFLES